MSAGVLQNIDEKRAEKLISENEKLVNLGSKVRLYHDKLYILEPIEH